MIRFGIILMLVCLVASAVLVITYRITNPLIIVQKEKEEREALKSVLVDTDEFKKADDYYLAYKNNNLSGYVLKIKAKGYSAPIEMLVGIDLEGSIQGISILDQKETPGLGAKISEIKYGENQPWFLNQFRGKKAVELDFPAINAVTGATISSRAVMETVKQEINKFLKTITN